MRQRRTSREAGTGGGSSNSAGGYSSLGNTPTVRDGHTPLSTQLSRFGSTVAGGWAGWEAAGRLPAAGTCRGAPARGWLCIG